ncbi:hypothetical protein [Leptolyngbya sp. FACHB-261]|uniref:hypothetical protein n=1 Tax=Leptolyngbya sp. FACHB-261 TaxID=2692806 RepID=UPI00168372DD|nr:hypothetical protein [Leptolyngbya sp. FACHB-261]MBD2104764.1 hypothetical protein [Leptolyngbya sp. FACHB-261]
MQKLLASSLLVLLALLSTSKAQAQITAQITVDDQRQSSPMRAIDPSRYPYRYRPEPSNNMPAQAIDLNRYPYSDSNPAGTVTQGSVTPTSRYQQAGSSMPRTSRTRRRTPVQGRTTVRVNNNGTTVWQSPYGEVTVERP